MGEAGWEQARILAGRPAAGHELKEDYNPLEAGLFSAMSVTKARPLQRFCAPRYICAIIVKLSGPSTES